ncbi:MAG TPA: hypothetical protein VLA43_13610 [Longimicrobiales bacterium]|nr:hypothetical protein [Longimicrobiales bacterium]
MPERKGPKWADISEIIAIVASILLAFAIDAWWDEWQEAREAREILVDLREEFRAVGAELAVREGEWQAAEASMARLLRAADAGEAPPPAVMDTLLHHLTWTSTFDPGSGALEALLSSGRLEWIEDLELRTALAGWPGVIEEIRDNEEMGREFVTLVLEPYLARQGVPLSRVLLMDREWPVPSVRDPEAAEAYRRLMADPEFHAHVAYRYSWVNVDEYQEGAASLARLMERLEGTLDR